MNYGGAYRNTPKHLVAQAAAENLQVIEDLVSTKNSEFLILRTSAPGPTRLRRTPISCCMARSFTPSYWGHLGLPQPHPEFPFAGLRCLSHTAAASLFPPNARVADMAHAQHALVGYVHPYDSVPIP